MALEVKSILHLIYACLYGSVAPIPQYKEKGPLRELKK